MTRRSLVLAVLAAAMTAPSLAFLLSSSSSSSSSRPLAPLHVLSSAMLTSFDLGSINPNDIDDDHHPPQPHISLPHGVHAPVTAINSPQELADFLAQDDRLCVIKFHASWCKSCQRMGLKFQGLANQKTDWIQDRDGSIVRPGAMRFGSIEFGANTGMCRTLDIKRLPTVHFYRQGHQLDGFACGPSKFPRLVETMEQLLQKQAQHDSFAATLQQGEELIRNSGQVAGILQQMMEQEANGTLESKTSKKTTNNKAWWNPLP